MIIIRRIFKQKVNSGIVVISLVIGLGCVNLIAIFINREINTDSFHHDKDHIYALMGDDPWLPGSKMYHTRFGSAEYMQTNFSEVEDYCRIKNEASKKIVASNEPYFDQPGIIAASKNFFEFFSYELILGNPKNALASNSSLVISEELSRKYFGDFSPIGQVITLVGREQEEKVIVNGIFKKPLDNTQIKFDMVRLIDESDSRCYLKLSSKANPKELEKTFEAHRTSIPIIHTGDPGSYYLNSLNNTYFDTTRRSNMEVSRDQTDLWTALIIGLLILMVASINFLGLTNNRLNEKKEEYAVRKINGSSNYALILDHMKEILLMMAFSITLSYLLMLWIMPFFNQLINTSLSLNYIFQIETGLIFLYIVATLLFVTFLFVAFYVRFKLSTQILKKRKNKYTKPFQFPAFSIFQLATSIALIVCSFVILKQINFINERPIGLDREVIEVKIPPQYADQVRIFKGKILKDASIDQVSIATASPVLEHFLVLLFYEDSGVEKQYSPAGFSGDGNYIETLGIKLLEGKDFGGVPNSNKSKCVINQTLAKMFPDQNLIGKELPGMDDQIVIGIVEDFHYSSLKSPVEPAFVSYNENGLHLMVKAVDDRQPEAIKVVTKIWDELIPDYPLEVESIGERYEWLHRENTNYIQLIGACCLISIFLSMIGLFANSYHSSRYRTKEISIRKVNGAKISDVLTMLNKDFVKWVVIAFVIATPIAWHAMNKWLENFAYKTELSWWVFALVGVLALGIALLTVSWQSWKAATRNPVEALRYE